ncbi:ricin-type beta-trefoil lectin domain protein [Actinokineospora diospyrosa]|uniref:Ricin-type beta-trefoil lectin domain-containing protein n=1 Tax=Actinokineospora diospyrosa TaxID=103728 RepID=A0ABT1ILN3_9PSEU|nr:ricin-type beta-trefoil lectin domain protein [Actinokineospora diospyrosa]MCP2273564.1 Ricin-type beta-trefoil lectin domain-containing protein [Actinokineospora diospyrosa]
MRVLLLSAGLLLLTPAVASAGVAEGEVHVRSVSTGQCLTRPVEPGVVSGQACSPLDRQAWQLTATDDLRVAITAAGTDLCLSYTDLDDVVTQPCDELEAPQAWRLVEQESGYWVQAAKDDAGVSWCLWHADGGEYVGLQPCAGSVPGERWELPVFGE